MLALELDSAARMAAQSCDIMLWQQSVAGGKLSKARQMAKKGIRELKELDADFRAYWPLRNKGTTAKCSAFLRWRIQDYERETLFYPPAVASVTQVKTYAAE